MNYLTLLLARISAARPQLTIYAVVASVLFAWHLWDRHEAVVKAVADVRTEYALAQAAANAEARQLEQRRASVAQETTDALIKAKNKAAAAAAGANDELGRLRLALKSQPADPGPVPETPSGVDGTRERELLDECAGVVQGLAQEADRLANKSSALQAFLRGMQLDK
jgi:hypothetical protein